MENANLEATLDSSGGGIGPSSDGSGAVRVSDDLAGNYIDRYNKGRNIDKDPNGDSDEGIHYGQHPPSTTRPVAAAPVPAPPLVVKPGHVNTPAQNAALHRHTVGEY